MESPNIFSNGIQTLSLQTEGKVVISAGDEETVVTPPDVKSVYVNDNESVVFFSLGKSREAYFSKSQDDALQLAAAISRHLQLGSPTQARQSVVDAGIIPGAAFLMSFLMTALLSFAAFSSDGSGAVRAGKARFMKRLVETLGPTGVLVVGCPLTLVALYYLFSAISKRGYMTIYSKP